TEGQSMLTAVLADFAAVPGVQVCTLLNEPLPTSAEVALCPDPKEEQALFRRLSATADYTLVIAPEFDDLLLERAGWVEEAGGHLLGSTLEAIRLTGDKLALSDFFRSKNIPTPRSWPMPIGGTLPGVSLPAVWKPRC